MAGYIKLNRKILEWEWYKDINTKTLFLHCLLKANWKPGSFQGETIPRGSFATSVISLASETGLTIRQTRTALEHLQTTNELTIKTTNKYSVVTVNNYELYQDDDKQDGKQTTNNDEETRHSDDNNRRNKEDNKNNNINVQKEANEMFERVWGLYPFRKKGKGDVSQAKKRYLYSTVGEEQFIRCLNRFKSDMSNRDPQYIMQGSTFFNSGHVDYLDENYKTAMDIEDTNVETSSKQLKRKLQ